jgi:outer membrane protein
MSRLSLLPLAAVCVAACTFSPAAFAQSKIGVVDLRKAILDTAEIKKASNDMEARYKKRRDDLDKAQRELEDLKTQAQSSQGRLSPQGEAELTARGQKQERLVTRLTQDLQDDVNHDRDTIIQSAGQRMTEVLRKIMDEKGLEAVVDVSQLVTFKPSLEITADAIAAFDKAYPLKK